MTPEELNEMQERCDKATPGPWEWNGRYLSQSGKAETSFDVGFVLDVDSGFDDSDAEFIAHSRTDIPKLIAEVRRLQASLVPLCAHEVTDVMKETGLYRELEQENARLSEIVENQTATILEWEEHRCELGLAIETGKQRAGLRAELEKVRHQRDQLAKAVNEKYEQMSALMKERDQLRERVGSLFDRIKHGDEKHQTWLKINIEDHFFSTRPSSNPPPDEL